MTPDQESKLIEVFQLSENDRLSLWEKERLIEWNDEYQRYGSNYYLSQKQWAIIDKIYEKIYGQIYGS